MGKNGFTGFSVENRQLIDDAMKRAARDALLAHKRAGVPIAGWRDGKVVTIPAEEVAIPLLEEVPPGHSGTVAAPNRKG